MALNAVSGLLSVGIFPICGQASQRIQFEDEPSRHLPIERLHVNDGSHPSQEKVFVEQTQAHPGLPMQCLERLDDIRAFLKGERQRLAEMHSRVFKPLVDFLKVLDLCLQVCQRFSTRRSFGCWRMQWDDRLLPVSCSGGGCGFIFRLHRSFLSWFRSGYPCGAFLLERHAFPRFGRTKLAVVVDKDKMTLLHVENHVRDAVPIDILEGKRDHCQVLPRADERWPDVDLPFGGVPTWELDHLDLSGEIEYEEVTGMGHTVVVPYYRVSLEGARSPVVPVILGDLPPRGQQA